MALARDMSSPTSVSMARVIAPARRRQGLHRVAEGIVRGLLAGGIAGALLIALDHLHPVVAAIVPAVTALALGVLVGAIYGMRQWPRTVQAARAIDRQFGLHDRVTTALQLETAPSALTALQRADAERHLQGVDVRRSAVWQWRRWELPAAAVVCLLVLALTFLALPTPSHHGPAATPGDRRRFHQAAQVAIPHLVQRSQSAVTPSARNNPALRALTLKLQHLQRQLLHATNRAAALRAISSTQAQLRHIAATLHPISPRAAAALYHALANRPPPPSSSANAQTANQLRQLAQSIAHLSAAQRAALARSLAKAANATPDSTLRSALQSAASSLAYGDPQSAASTLRRAAGALDQSPAAAQAKAQLEAAAAGLDPVKGQVTGLGGSAAGARGSGKGTGTGSGQGKGAGSGSATGQGRGNGRGQGRGNGAGQGHGSGAGQARGAGSGTGRGRTSSGSGGAGGTGGHGIGGGRGGAGRHGTGHYGARVFVPATKTGNGPHTIQTGGPSGAPLGGSTVPYQQVLGQYRQSERTALDHSALPPALQTYVRQYFSTISH